MEQNVGRGLGFHARLVSTPAAGEAGTGQHRRSYHRGRLSGLAHLPRLLGDGTRAPQEPALRGKLRHGVLPAGPLGVLGFAYFRIVRQFHRQMAGTPNPNRSVLET